MLFWEQPRKLPLTIPTGLLAAGHHAAYSEQGTAANAPRERHISLLACAGSGFIPKHMLSAIVLQTTSPMHLSRHLQQPDAVFGEASVDELQAGPVHLARHKVLEQHLWRVGYEGIASKGAAK
jgi:hypothetical protein